MSRSGVNSETPDFLIDHFTSHSPTTDPGILSLGRLGVFDSLNVHLLPR